MPRFYFNLYNDVIVIDDEGIELADLDAVRREAERSAIAMICRAVKDERAINLKHRIEVEDGDRRPVLTLPFGSLITIER